MSLKCYMASRNRGMTLIEVVTGLLLLASLLVGILKAFGQLTHQIRHSQIRLEAAHAADTLLAKWYSQGGMLPRDDEGEVPGCSKFVWRLNPLENKINEEFDVSTVRFELYYRDPENAGTTNKKDQILFEEPLISIDLVVPSSGR